MSICELLHTVVEGHSLTEEQAEDGNARAAGGRVDAGADRGFSDRAADEGRNGGRADRIRPRDARRRDARADRGPITGRCSIPAGRAATGLRLSIFRRSRLLWWRARACAWPSTAIGRFRASAAARMFWKRLGVRTAVEPEVVARAIREVGIGFLFAPAVPRRDAARAAGSDRTEDAHGLQFSGSADQSGAGGDPGGGNLVGRSGREDCRGDGAARGAAGLCGARVRWAGRVDDYRAFDGICGPAWRGFADGGFAWGFWFEAAVRGGSCGGDAEQNRAIAESILGGERGPARDIVLMNAALALVAAGVAVDFREGVMRAEESIDSGAARGKLDSLREISS